MIFADQTIKPLLTVSLLVSLAIGALFASGCTHAPPARETCQELDWYEMGRRDGSRGLTDNNQRSVKVVCDDTDQSLSEALYQNGFDSGIAQFCNYSIAFEQGRLHQPSSASTCPLFLRDEFARGYESGIKYSALKQNQKEIVNQIENIEQTLKDESTDQMRKNALSGEKIQLEQKRRELEAELTKTESSKQL